MTMKGLRLLTASAGLLISLAFTSGNAMANEPAPDSTLESANESAPDFTLESRDSGNIRLSEQRGNIVMVNFWASWCGPCREELPKMEALYQKHQDKGFEILAVNVDDEASKARILLDDIKVSFPVLYDTAGKVSELYDVNGMPTTVIIDRDGNKRLVHKGYRAGDEKKYEDTLKILMRE
ncbi:MAG: peroxiredoxin [Alphaproteobacteria bacterium]|jgi:peroxiredoxin